jgi:hypothetical protein
MKHATVQNSDVPQPPLDGADSHRPDMPFACGHDQMRLQNFRRHLLYNCGLFHS